MAYTLFELPPTKISDLNPRNVIKLPSATGAVSALPCRDSLSTFSFQMNWNFAMLSIEIYGSTRIHDVRCASNPCVVQSGALRACAYRSPLIADAKAIAATPG